MNKVLKAFVVVCDWLASLPHVVLLNNDYVEHPESMPLCSYAASVAGGLIGVAFCALFVLFVLSALVMVAIKETTVTAVVVGFISMMLLVSFLRMKLKDSTGR